MLSEETVEGNTQLDCTVHFLCCLKSVRFLPATSSPKDHIWEKEKVVCIDCSILRTEILQSCGGF